MRRVRGDSAGRRDEYFTVCAASVGGPLHPQSKLHRQCAIGGTQRRRQQQKRRRQSERKSQRETAHTSPVSPPSPSSGVVIPRSGWAWAALVPRRHGSLSAVAGFGSSVKRSYHRDTRKLNSSIALELTWSSYKLNHVWKQGPIFLFVGEPAPARRPGIAHTLSFYTLATARPALPALTKLLRLR